MAHFNALGKSPQTVDDDKTVWVIQDRYLSKSDSLNVATSSSIHCGRVDALTRVHEYLKDAVSHLLPDAEGQKVKLALKHYSSFVMEKPKGVWHVTKVGHDDARVLYGLYKIVRDPDFEQLVVLKQAQDGQFERNDEDEVDRNCIEELVYGITQSRSNVQITQYAVAQLQTTPTVKPTASL